MYRQTNGHTMIKVKFLSKNSILTKPQHFHEFFTQIFFDKFLVKSKLLTAKKSKTATFLRVFTQNNSTIFLGKSKLNFWTKNEDFEQCDSNRYLRWHWNRDRDGTLHFGRSWNSPIWSYEWIPFWVARESWICSKVAWFRCWMKKLFLSEPDDNFHRKGRTVCFEFWLCC